MESINQVVLTGNVGKEPSVRTIQGQKGAFKVADFWIAVEVGWGENKQTHWMLVKANGYLADYVEKYISKGSSVLVTGMLMENSWTDKEGKEQRIKYIYPDNIRQMFRANGDNSTYKKEEGDSDDLPY